MKNTTMTVVMLEPGKEAYIKEIGTSLEAMQAVVGGYIQAVYPWDYPAAIVCNEEGKLLGLPLNRALYMEENGERMIYDILAGNAFICGLGEDDFCSLTPEQQERYLEMFRHPEAFVQTSRGIVSLML